MATVNGPLLPKIGKPFHMRSVGEIGHPNTHIGKLRRYVIDNPRDEGLKRRETLWNFQQKHRGALVSLKGDTSIKENREPGRKSLEERNEPSQDAVKLKGDLHTKENHEIGCNTQVDNSRPTHDKSENEKGKNAKFLNFQKLKRKQRSESRVMLGASTGDLSELRKDTTVAYSTALRIGNSVYNQMKGTELSTSSRSTLYGEDVKKAIVRSIDKLPDLSASLTKLGYLKVNKNVVHYGGGFFGRYSDRPYKHMKRSWSTLSPPEVQERIRGRIVAPTTAPSSTRLEKSKTLMKKRLEFIDTLSIQQSSPPKASSKDDESRSVSTADNSSKVTFQSISRSSHHTVSEEKRPLPIKEHVRRRERRLQKLRNQQSARLFAPMITKQSLEEKKERTDKKLFMETVDSHQRKLAVVRRERSKAKSDLESVKRTVSEQGLDLPKDKYGPTTQTKDKRPSLYGNNPYRWTSKTSLSLDDKSWVKRTIQQADVVDNSSYDSFARIKPSQIQKASTELSIEKHRR